MSKSDKNVTRMVAADSHSRLFVRHELERHERRRIEPSDLLPVDELRTNARGHRVARLAIAAHSSTASGLIDISAVCDRTHPVVRAHAVPAFVIARLLATPAATPTLAPVAGPPRASIVLFSISVALLTIVVAMLAYLLLAIAPSYL